jgi:hypothetical protein
LTSVVFWLLAVVLALLLVGFAWRQKDEAFQLRAPTAAVGAAGILTIGLGVLLLLLASPNEDIRLSALQLQFARGPEDGLRKISVGGNPEIDELVVRRRQGDVLAPTTSGLLTIDETKNDYFQLNLAAQDAASLYRAGSEADILSAVEIDRLLIGSVRIGPETQICVQQSAAKAEQCFQYDQSRNALHAVGAPDRVGPALERRGTIIKGLTLGEWGPRQRIYPLRHYVPVEAAAAGGASGPQATGAAETAPRAAAATGGFFYRSGVGELRYLNLDKSVIVRGASDAAAPPDLCLSAEGCLSRTKARVFEVRLGDAPPRDGDGPWSPGRLEELRSFDVVVAAAGPQDGANAAVASGAKANGAAGKGGVDAVESRAPAALLLLRLDTPDQIILTDAALEQEQMRLNKAAAAAGGVGDGRSTPQTGSLTLELGVGSDTTDWGNRAISTVRFAALGGALVNDIAQRVTISSDAVVMDNADGQAGGGVRIDNGGTVRIGANNAAIIRVDRLLYGQWPPMTVSLLVLAIAGVGGLLATWRARTSSLTGFALFSLLDLMLVMRVLIGVSAVHVDPGEGARQFTPDALAAFLLGPVLLSLVFRVTYETPLRLALHGLMAAFLVFGVQQTFEAKSAAIDLALLGSIGASFIGFAMFAAARLRPQSNTKSFVMPKWDFAALAGRLTANVGDKWFDGWAWAVMGVIVARTALLFLSVQESITIAGVRFSLSIAYVPITIVLFAWLFAGWVRVGQDNDKHRHFAIKFLVAFAALCILPVAFAKDTGAVIYSLPIALFGLFIAAVPQSPSPSRVQSLLGWGCLIFGAFASIGFFLTFATTTFSTADLLSMMLGSALVILLAAIAAAAPCYLLWKAPRLVGALPAAGLAAMIAIANLAPVFLGGRMDEARLQRVLETKEDKSDDAKFLEELQGYEAWQLRILALIDSNALVGLGTVEAEGQRIAFIHMADHTKLMEGKGFLEQDPPTRSGLLRYHTNDNVTAVHLLAPFGRIGGAIYIAALFAAFMLAVVAASRLRAGRVGDFEPFPYFVGALAIGTLVMVSAYMVLANLGAAPFTGRNAYLLAVSSVGDFIEAMALFVMAALFIGNGVSTSEGARS